tara:strand:+ start:121 stop:675 length:555 start_codon:yes stop_codon:yes gene_type:complete
MSNITVANTTLKTIKDAFIGLDKKTTKAKQEFAIEMDKVAKVMTWTDAVSPTKANVASGKSTASEETYGQLKTMFKEVLIARKLPHTSTDIGSKIKDLKNALMRRKAPELFALTGGDMREVDNVSVDGKVTMKEKTEQTPIEKAENMVKSLKSFLEKNQAELGDNYKTMHRATLQMMTDCKIKI